ncbi:hypothetical protein [uncultured Gammaproteobacteria bacterium]|nr:hypothetical protein [uncultured Gammaproteobacteria bacterium]CAC9600547.1 hypothetical protein [uncultured Gammaproteobacteria bacterium]
MKKIIYTLLGLIVTVTIVIITLLDPIGKKISQQYATELLKTPVKISQFSSDFLDKSINIDFIEVKNPPNFKNENAFSLDHFSLKVGDSDNNLIVLDEIFLNGLAFTLEQNDSNVNLTQLIDNLDQAPSQSSDVSSSDNSNTNEKRIKIKHFKVSNISLKVDSEWLRTTLKVPNISISNFGGDSGIRIDKIGKEVTKKIMNNLRKALEEKGIEAGKKEIEASLRRKIAQQLGVASDELKDTVKDLFKNFDF